MTWRPLLFDLWRQEFGGYTRAHFGRDLLAGLTVAAVALPLALAFGVASAATAAAGLVTAIIAGIVIGALGGAPYQISGPTGAMSAVLVVIAQRHGLRGLWLAGTMAGAMILALGLFRLGRVINFIPAPVITGFTSGIALIIAIGQLDNFFGIQTPTAESAAHKALGYLTGAPIVPNRWAVACALATIGAMVLLPRAGRAKHLPAALAGIALVTGVSWAAGWQVATIGAIPRGIILADRFVPRPDDLDLLGALFAPAVAIAALGSIESLLAGVVAGRMTGTKLAVNQELVAQGVGNLLLPFFGGVPATAAIARISVGIKAGGATRMVSFVHSAALLAGALFLGGAIAHIPLAALAGVLLVTAWRMNEWHVIGYYVKRRLKGPLLVLLATMVATVALDLTQAILVGIGLSLLLFISQVSRLQIVPTTVDWDRLRAAGHAVPPEVPEMQVVYVSGTLYFGVVNQLTEALDHLPATPVVILSMRGVPMVDVSCVHAIEHLWQHQSTQGGTLLISGLQPPVRRLFERARLVETLGVDKFFWSADLAILHACREFPALTAAGQPVGTVVDEGEAALNDLPLGVVPMQ